MAEPYTHDNGVPHSHEQQEAPEQVIEKQGAELNRAGRIVARLREELTLANEARIAAQVDVDTLNEQIQALVEANQTLAGELQTYRDGIAAAANAAAVAHDDGVEVVDGEMVVVADA